MLKIKTYVAPSKIIPQAGLGLFAGENIKKGMIIWKLDEDLDIVMSEDEFNRKVDPNVQTFLKTYCYKEDGKYILCVDNGRFINHSVEFCNTLEERGLTLASRDISEGEEILSNYENFSVKKEDKSFNITL